VVKRASMELQTSSAFGSFHPHAHLESPCRAMEILTKRVTSNLTCMHWVKVHTPQEGGVSRTIPIFPIRADMRVLFHAGSLLAALLK